MAIQTLTPGTLTDTTYPANTQTLLQTFAGALYAPTATKEMYSQASNSGISTNKDAIWYNETDRTLEVYDDTTTAGWKPITNTVENFATSTQNFTNATIGLSTSAFTGTNSNLITTPNFTLRGAGNQVRVIASAPWVVSSLANDIIVAYLMWSGGTTAIGVAYAQVPAVNAPVSLTVQAIHTPGSGARGVAHTYGLRIASTTSGATLRVGQTGGNATVWAPMTIVATELPPPH